MGVAKIMSIRQAKEPRAMHGKVRKHHWFKHASTLMLNELDQRRAEAERKRIAEAKKPQMFGSIKELFR